MQSLYLLIPIALILVAVAIAIFVWAIRSGQYDNLDTEAHRILFDDDDDPPAERERDPDERPGDER